MLSQHLNIVLSHLILGSQKLGILQEQWLSCEGHWRESALYKKLLEKTTHRRFGSRKWLTKPELAMKYSMEVAEAIIAAKHADPELSKSQIRKHPDCPDVLQYYVWDQEGDEETHDEIVETMFEARDVDKEDGRKKRKWSSSSRSVKKSKKSKSKKKKKTKGNKKKKKASSSSSSSSSASSSSSPPSSATVSSKSSLSHGKQKGKKNCKGKSKKEKKGKDTETDAQRQKREKKEQEEERKAKEKEEKEKKKEEEKRKRDNLREHVTKARKASLLATVHAYICMCSCNCS